MSYKSKRISTSWYLSIWLLVAGLVSLRAQPINKNIDDVMLPSADAAALESYIQLPVDYATGIAQVSLPIHTIKDGSLQVPISLSYHTGGIRLAEPATWVGQNWTLSTGGMITRTIQGIKDEDINGYYFKGDTLTESICDLATTYLCTDSDSEPDIFFAAYPGGSFKFYYDETKTPILIAAEKDVDIKTLSIEGIPFAGFEIIDEYGTRYIYGQETIGGPIARETSESPGQSNPDVTSWYLLKILSYDGRYSITYTYSVETYSLQSKASSEYTYRSNSSSGESGNGTPLNNPPTIFYRNIQMSTPRLTSISSTTEQISFIADTQREDMSRKRLDRIDITTDINTPYYCKSFDFSYDYYVDNSLSTNPLGKRLQLLSVAERSCDGSITKSPYEFHYKGTKINGKYYLPHRLTHQVDHWGYYNGKTANDNNRVNVPSMTVAGISYGASDRSIDSTKTQQGVLEKITWPTGGTTQYTYEQNEGQQSTVSIEQQTLLQMTSPCTFGSCCGILDSIRTLSFTGEEIAQMTFDIEASAVSNQSCNTSSYAKISIEDLTTSQVYSYQVDLVPMNGNGTVVEKMIEVPIDSILTIDSAQLYKFTLRSWNCYGTFRLKTISSTGTLINDLAPGLRIAAIEQHDGIDVANDITTYFDYSLSESTTQSSGRLLTNQPGYTRLISDVDGNGAYHAIWSDMPTGVLSDIHGSNIVYGRVKVSQSGQGYTEYIYDNSPAYPTYDAFPYCDGQNPSQQIPTGTQCTGDGCIQPPYTGNTGRRGKLLQMKTYHESGSLLQSSDYEYEVTSLPSQGVMLKYRNYGYCPAGVYAFYKIYSHRTRLIERIDTQDGVTSITSYSYDSQDRHSQATQITTANSDGTSYSTHLSYPYDYTINTNLANQLIAENRILPAWQTEILADNLLINGQRMVYGLLNPVTGVMSSSAFYTTGRVIYPRTLYTREVTWDDTGGYQDDGWIEQADQTHYDIATGRPTEVQLTGWSDPITYDWTPSGRMSQWRYKDYTKGYSYHTDTDLIQADTAIDGTIRSYQWDDLIRPESITDQQRSINTFLTYHYGTGSDLNYTKVNRYYPTIGDTPKNIKTLQFYDGLGRQKQVKRYLQDPTDPSKSILTEQEYDSYGHLIETYEPKAESVAENTYSSSTQTQYTLTTYEASPLNRVATTTPPSWHATTTSYGANVANEVTNHHTGTAYPAGTLYKTTITDPEGQVTESFTDLRGNLILNRVKKNASTTNANEIADTYYLYDLKDRLITILPPQTSLTDSDMIFRRVYSGDDLLLSDDRPDSEPVSMIYDDRDLLTYRQDGVQQTEGRWYAYEYDDYGQILYEGFAPDSSSTITDTLISNTWGDTGIQKGKLIACEKKLLNNQDNSTISTILQDYEYDGAGRLVITRSNSILHPTPGSIVDSLILDSQDNILESYQKIIPDDITIKRRYTYDHVGRQKEAFIQITTPEQTWPEQELSAISYDAKELITDLNLGGGLQNVDYLYKPNRLLDRINTSYSGFLNTMDPVTGSYDLFGMNIGYDNDIDFNVKGETPLKDGNISQLQWSYRTADGTEEYKHAYGLQYDWLKRIKSATYSEDNNNQGTAGHFNTTYSYDDHRGNFSTVTRKSDGVMIDNLNYSYHPGTNQIKSISDGVTIPTQQKKGYKSNTSMDYVQDENGAMTFDAGLNVAFENNHLNLPKIVSVPDSSGAVYYYYDAMGTLLRQEEVRDSTVIKARDYIGSVEYVNGVIEQIRHNDGYILMDRGLIDDHLYLTGTESGDNTYETLTTVSERDINSPDSVSYRSEEFIILTRGFEVDLGADFTAMIDTFPVTGLSYRYFLKDHLSNIRLEFTDANDDGTAEVLSNHNYYAFGLSWADETKTDNNYLYNGKEVQKSFDLGYLNYGARFYDPAVGRFTSIDPLASDFSRWSPYAYTFNNPIRYTDPTGMAPNDIILRGNNNSSVTIKTDLIDIDLDASEFVGDLGGNYTLEGGDIVDAALDIGGLVDPTGTVDATAAVYHGSEGNYGSAIISGFSVLPGGDLLKVAKAGKHTKTIKHAINTVKNGRSGKQAKLKELASDPKVSSADRGWIKSEMNQIKSGSRKNIRNPPGKDLAHERGREAAKGYSYKHSNLQDRDLHRRQHKHDNGGRKNKERPINP